MNFYESFEDEKEYIESYYYITKKGYCYMKTYINYKFYKCKRISEEDFICAYERVNNL